MNEQIPLSPAALSVALIPDAAQVNSDPRYLRRLIERTGMTQEEVAQRIGISFRAMRNYLSEAAARPAPYLVQFALECLAERFSPIGRVELDRFDAMIAFQKLTPEAQMDHWLRAKGHVRTFDDLHECPSLEEVVALGANWVACSDRLPEEDTRGRLAYMVYCPTADNWLLRCRFVAGRWCQYTDHFIGGVTHWRLAGKDEKDRRVKSAELPVL